jgi:hypothetical protein
MWSYVLLASGVIAILSAFLFRSPRFVIVNGLLLEVWLIVLAAGLIAFSIGALLVFRSVI